MKPIVLDLETNIGKGIHGSDAKDPANDFYTIIYGTTPENVVAEHKPEGFSRTTSEGFRSALEVSDTIVGHNLMFDIPYVWNDEAVKQFFDNGGILWDTQLAEYLMSGQRHTFPSLAELQVIYMNQKVKQDRVSKLFKKGYGADKIIAARLTHPRVFRMFDQYSADDGTTTLRILEKQMERAEQLGMLKIIKMFNRYLLSLIQSSKSGIHLDLDKVQTTMRDFKLKEIELLQKAQQLVKPHWSDERLPEFNVKSPQHKSAMLFGGQIKCVVRRLVGEYKNGKPKYKNMDETVDVKGFGLDLSYTAESKIAGRYKTDADVISKIAATSSNEEAKQYCQYQKESMNYGKMATTYLQAFLDRSLDGVLYPNYNITKTATSRLSSSHPNLQNVPSKGPMAKAIQGCFVAPKGWKCVQIDFSQLEIYVLAWLSGDRKMTSDLLGGIDFHCLRLSWCTSMSEGKSYDEIYKLAKEDNNPEWALKRSKAKIISYQKAYGAGPKRLSETTGLHVDDVKELLNKEDNVYSRVKGFNEHVYMQVENNSEYSNKKHIPRASVMSSQRRFCDKGWELLPVFTGQSTYFEKTQYRKVGYYQSVTKKRYAFEEFGVIDRNGKLRQNFSPTQTKNYQIQGTAADVVAAGMAAMVPLLRKHPDRVKLINTIHDSCWFYVREDSVQSIVPHLCKIMENVPTVLKKYLDLDVPFNFPVDAEVGDNFAALEPFKMEG